MSLEINNSTYNSRAVSSFQNILLRIRAWFYEKEIVKSLFDMIWRQKSCWLNIDLWCGAWHKTEVISNTLIDEGWKLIWIEPARWMRRVAQKRLKWKNVVIKKWDSSDLSDYEDVENIFCNQMTHHLDDEWKKELFRNAYKSLANGWRIIILDTTIPKSWFLALIFRWLIKWYRDYIWKWNFYHNISTQEYIDLLQEAWFEIDLRFTRHFYILWKIWEIWTKLWFLYPFMTQIVARKK